MNKPNITLKSRYLDYYHTEGYLWLCSDDSGFASCYGLGSTPKLAYDNWYKIKGSQFDDWYNYDPDTDSCLESMA